MSRETPSRKLRVGLVQMQCAENTDANIERAIAGVEEAAGKGAEVICLPELFRSRYFCQSEDVAFFDLAESIPGPSTARLAEVARQRKVTIIASLFERRVAGVYHNTTVILDAAGQIVGKYRKMHIPDDPSYYEKFYFTPGDLGFASFPVGPVNIGVLICWDQWFPEAARLTALSGAQILFYPTAIGWLSRDKEQYGVEQHNAWETVQRGHAISNGLFVAAVNRVGREGELEFWGRSFVADPMGNLIARAGEGEETVIVDLDLGRIESVRRNWPFLRDRRIDAYRGIESRILD